MEIDGFALADYARWDMTFRHQQSALLSYLFQSGQNGFREAYALAKSPPGVLHADSTDQSGQKPVESCHRQFLFIRGRFTVPGPCVSTRKYMGHDESHLRPLLSRETSSDQRSKMGCSE